MSEENILEAQTDEVLGVMYQRLLGMAEGEEISTRILGICDNLMCDERPRVVDTALAMDFVGEFAPQWPRYSGSRLFPVPDPDADPATPQKSAEAAYYSTEDVWTGEYGELRMELAAFLLKQVNIELTRRGLL